MQTPDVLRKRDDSLDIAKGLLMASVVLGHIQSPIGGIFYLYHIQGFVFVSGMLFFPERSGWSLGRFLRSRLERLYVPYLGFNALFVLAHNALNWLGMLGGKHAVTLSTWESVKSMVFSFKVPHEQLAGALWYVPVLLVLEVLYFLLCLATRQRSRPFALRAGAVLVLWGVGDILIRRHVVPYLDYRYLVYLPFYLLGHGFRTHGGSPRLGAATAVLGAAGVAVAYRLGCDMTVYGNSSALWFLPVSLAGIVAVLSASRLMSGLRIFKPVAAVGRSTLWILGLHFLAFKAASCLLDRTIGCGDDAYSSLAGNCLERGIAVPVYLLAGLCLPMLAMIAFRRIVELTIRTKAET